MTSTCEVRFPTSLLIGGRGSPCVEELAELFAVSWRSMVKKRCPLVACQAATRGLRELSQTELVGSRRPGLNLVGVSVRQHPQACKKPLRESQLVVLQDRLSSVKRSAHRRARHELEFIRLEPVWYIPINIPTWATRSNPLTNTPGGYCRHPRRHLGRFGRRPR